MPFNIRVYGIWIDKSKGVLVSDELIRGKEYVKFPGGGLEFGEGTRDCLKREFMEEMNLPIRVDEHIYTTDFFQQSAFRAEDQIISIYYYVTPLTEPDLSQVHTDTPAEYETGKPHADQESFRFIAFSEFSEHHLSLPIDKIVARMIRDRFP